MVKVGDEDPEEEWTDIEGVVSARAVGRRSWGGCWRSSMPKEKEKERERVVVGEREWKA